MVVVFLLFGLGAFKKSPSLFVVNNVDLAQVVSSLGLGVEDV